MTGLDLDEIEEIVKKYSAMNYWCKQDVYDYSSEIDPNDVLKLIARIRELEGKMEYIHNNLKTAREIEASHRQD